MLILIVLCQPPVAGYTDLQQRFSLEPPKGWQVQMDKSGVATFMAPDGVTALIIFPKRVSESTTLDTLPLAYERLLKEAQPGVSVELLEGMSFEIAGQPALQRVYAIKRGPGERARAMVTFIKVGKLSLTLAATTSEKEFAEYKQVFLKSLQTLRFPTPGRPITTPDLPLKPSDVTISPSDIVTREETISVPPHIEDMIQVSSFIFMGTVRKFNAAAMPVAAITDNMVIVAVDEVFQAARTLGDYTGKNITVLLKDLGNVEVGQRMVFFTNGWLYGESIVVREVGKLLVQQEAARLRRQVIEGIKIVADKNLMRYIARAELVVAGSVIDVRQADIPQGRRDRSEHDPMWREAVIEIKSMEKGSFPEGTITVMFPNSMDIMWYKTPKFSVRQERIWILRRDKPFVDEEIEAYMALDPRAVHPMDQLNRIKRLIRRVQ